MSTKWIFYDKTTGFEFNPFNYVGVRETGGIMKAYSSHPISDESFLILTIESLQIMLLVI
jgi:hypothetical protein